MYCSKIPKSATVAFFKDVLLVLFECEDISLHVNFKSFRFRSRFSVQWAGKRRSWCSNHLQRNNTSGQRNSCWNSPTKSMFCW